MSIPLDVCEAELDRLNLGYEEAKRDELKALLEQRPHFQSQATCAWVDEDENLIIYHLNGQGQWFLSAILDHEIATIYRLEVAVRGNR